MNSKRLIMIVVVPLVVVTGGYAGYDRVYRGPMSERQAELAEVRSSIAGAERALGQMMGLSDRLASLSATTLGTEFDTIEHRLRSGLSNIATSGGLVDVVVSNGRPEYQRSPVLARRVSRALSGPLRERPDFGVIRGRLAGVGGLRESLETLASVQSQPWIHRIDGFSIKPVGSERENYEIRIDFATLVSPDAIHGGTIADVPEVSPTDGAALAAVAPFVEKNIFKRPPAEVPVVATTVQETPPSPPAPTFDSWRLSAVVEAGQTEAWLVGPRGQSRVLTPGQSVYGAVFEGGAGERAVFQIEGARFEVVLGRTIGERRPLDE